MSDSPEVVRLPTPLPPSFQQPKVESYGNHRGQHTPIVIDNGSTTLRWGFGTFSDPLSGPNVISKFKERKNNRPLLLFGDAVEVEAGAKAQGRTPWEGDVLLNFDALENALDYAFIQLGIDTENVNHPILMTERLCSPLHSRALTSELMFEQYCVPSLAYCIDGIMSFYYNNLPAPNTPFTSDGIVISFNTASTSVIPILHGRGILSNAKRIPWGTAQSSEYLLKLIQLKYSNFPTRVTSPQANWMFRNFCEVAEDYTALIRSFRDPAVLRASEKIIQFPFALPVADEKTEEELAKQAEKRKEQGRKLQEMAAKTRMEKLVQKETDLQYLLSLKESKGDLPKREWQNKLNSEGFDDDATLDETIKKLDTDLKRTRKKEANIGGDEPMEETPSFPLADVPDDQLDEEGLKEKKKQKLLKAGFEARARARKEKEREREEKEREEKKEEEERDADLGAWSRRMRQEQETLMARIKDRAKRRAALSDRKSAAAQARMKNIANLASDERVPKKKRKGGGEDMFGADDADWAIYRKINTATVSSDEEEDLTQLQLIEQKLLQYDPTFTNQQTHAHLTSQRSALLTAFRPVYEEGDVEGIARIHLNTERWRVCETWFSPGIAGVDSAGLGEVLQNILSRYDEAQKSRLVKNVMITGTPSRIPGIVRRLHCTLRPILPPEMEIQIRSAQDPSNDAWRGMAKFSLTDEFNTVGITKAEYEEYGGERVKRWWGGNWNGSIVSSRAGSSGAGASSTPVDGDVEMDE
ncbi:chromatin remodeling complex subunit [Moniliophthora roreri]|uniref:Putative chromatin remodeling complex subunit n=1 Tax=Moniliophthora roreri TaxID=221103 RepID=A0A0W0G4M0_MONRR|nr:chromatin remodeling complex subunit [Moniliophthora roreri]